MKLLNDMNGRIFDRLWMPVYLVLVNTYLIGPWLHGDHYGRLSVTSWYQAFGEPWAWLLRSLIGLSAVILAVGAYRYVHPKTGVLAWLLYGVALLSLIDVIFAIGCGGVCTAFNSFSHIVHDTESVILWLTVAAATTYDIVRRRRVPSMLFAGLQLCIGLSGLIAFGVNQFIILLQFVYSMALSGWLVWLLYSHTPTYVFRSLQRWTVTKTMALLSFVFGAFLFLQALPGLFETISSHSFWPVCYAVVFGLALMYLSQHVVLGKLWAVLAVLGIAAMEVVHYAVFSVQPVLLVLLGLFAVFVASALSLYPVSRAHSNHLQ